MDFELTPEQKQVRDVARDFAQAELGDKIAPFDERHEFPHAIVAKLGPLGFLGALVPEEYGGAGLDYVSYALIVEELNRGDASVGITMWAHNSLCTNHVTLFASPAQKAKWLPRLAPGEIPGAWGLPEPGSGSEAAVDAAVKYMKQRTAFGKTLAEFNGLQGMIAELATEVEVARLLLLRAAYLKDSGRPAMHAAAMAKVFASEAAMKAATKAVQI